MKLPSGQTEIRAEVEAAQIKWLEAARTHSLEIYDQLLSNQFFCVTVDGFFIKKDAFLHGFENRLTEISKIEMNDLEYQVYADIVVVTGMIDFMAEINGVSFSGPQRFTSTWLRESAASPMRCVCFHVSDLRKREAWDKLLAKK